VENNEQLRRNMDMLEARREMAAIKEEKYKRKMEKSNNRKVLECVFKKGDYVLRSNVTSRAEPTGKLAPNWEGLTLYRRWPEKRPIS
jgi:hypothetical protein